MLKRKPGPWLLWNISPAVQMISKVGGQEEKPDPTYCLSHLPSLKNLPST